MRAPPLLCSPRGLLGLALLANLGCGASDDYAGASEATPTAGEGSYGEDPTPAPDDGLPDEQADSYYRAVPAATETFIYVANPDRDTVSKINATTRAVYTLPVGAHPTQVLTGAAGSPRAVVLNEADHTLTVLDVASDAASTLGIHPDTNFLSLRADTAFAVTWFSDRVEGASEDINGVRSYSAITVVALDDAPVATPLTVGLNPKGVTWITDEDRALVLCDEAVALVELGRAPTARLIPLTEDPDEEIEVAEIKVGPDGRYAFLRTGRPELLLVDLSRPTDPDAVTRLSLSGVPSDMELSDERLILVDRGNRQLLVFDPLDPFAEPDVIPTPPNQVVGAVAVAPEIGKAILYTTLTAADLVGTPLEGSPLDRFSVWDLDTDEIRVRDLVKPVAAVSLNHNPGLPVAVFVHPGDAPSDEAAFDGKEAFSQYYFEDSLVVPAVLEAPTLAIADSPTGRYAYLTLEETLRVVVIDYEARQMIGVPLQSAPVFSGILTGSEVGWVSQRHELGRLSFVDPVTLTVSTLTGFELNAQP